MIFGSLIHYEDNLIMSRKKTGRHVAKRKENTLVTVQKKEREFLKIPSTLSALLNKEVSTIKQKETQLKKSIAQLTTRITSFEKKSQTNPKLTTASEKKQFQIATRTYNTHLKTKELLVKQLKSTGESLLIAIDKQAKLMAFSKYINQFEKEWLKQFNKVVPLKKPKQAAHITEKIQSSSLESGTENVAVNNAA